MQSRMRRLTAGSSLVILLVGAVTFAATQQPTAAPPQQTSPPPPITFAEVHRFAEQGDASAQFNLAFMYAEGLGTPQDFAQAMAWYRKAADQGEASAMYNLGSMYSTGRGVVQDYVEGHKWRNLAAARASADNQKEYAATRDALTRLMTPQQLAEAQKRASDWMAAFEKRAKK